MLKLLGHRISVDENTNISVTDPSSGSIESQSVESFLLLCILHELVKMNRRESHEER